MSTDSPSPGEIRFRFDAIAEGLAAVKAEQRALDEKVDEKIDERQKAEGRLLTKMAVLETKMEALAKGQAGIKAALWSVAASLLIATVGLMISSGRFG